MKKTYKSILIITIIGIILFLVSFYFDAKALLFMDMIKNPFLDYFLGAVTHFGSVFIVLIIMTTLFMWGERKKEWIPVLWSSFIISTLICIILKVIVARERPLELISFFSVLNYSFPSLHATASFTAIGVLDREFPKFKWFWIMFAFVVAFSRIYLKVHYLSDVIFGAILGYAIGFIFVHLEERYGVFKKWFIFQKKS